VTWLLAAPASAADGVIEINQVRALAGGVTPGDAPGFPVTLDAPGGYRLTSNLDLRSLPGAASTSAILVAADHVAIDLGGFAILGPNVNSGSPPTTALTCSHAAQVDGGFGIDGRNRRNLVISRGSIDGTGFFGIWCGTACRVEHVQVSNTCSSGIQVGEAGHIEAATVDRAGFAGISAGNGAVVRGCTLRQSSSTGIGVANGATLERNTILSGYTSGIEAGDGVRVEGNVVRANRLLGIAVNFESQVLGNTVSANGSGGITAQTGTLLVDNAVTDNAGGSGGINTSGICAIGRNLIAGNTGGDLTSIGPGAIQVAPNVCGGDLTCP
jgi:hypothetical protein